MDRYSHPRRRLLDGRSAEARRLKAVMSALVQELGGSAALTAAQQLIIGQLREKLVALSAISQHLDRQAALIGEDGLLVPALRRSHLAYSNSIRRDLEALHGLRDGKKRAPASLADYLKQRGAKP
jgi:DNA-binding transcriptional ArsR family regulator